MRTKQSAKFATLAVLSALLTTGSAALAESEAGLQAQSQSSTQNAAQSSRETGTSSSSQNNSQSANQQTSQAVTRNNSSGTSEAIGGPVGSIRPAQMSGTNTINPARNSASNSGMNVSTSSHVPHAQTRSYAGGRRNKRSFSNAYMQRTIRQAAITK